ncbi:DUF1287 domain-containing protein [Clostridiaceae bacterium M8S5]|nr:DUF1287 domain-containing protein [Clostridiaceae bacterium M8S5]
MKKFKKSTIIVSLIMLSGIIFFIVNYAIYGRDVLYYFMPKIEIDKIVVKSDLDNDGLNDMDDIIQGARKEIANKTTYRSQYYKGGYPPTTEGVCTDVIWRALFNAGFNLKDNMDKDIKGNLKDYFRIDKIDSNIDFRRVPNQYVYFKRHMNSLTTEVIPRDKENLKQWQPGDIIVLTDNDKKWLSHVAIISDERRRDGVPYVLHNAYNRASEDDMLMYYYENGLIKGHFRFKYSY